jgi:saccharopine dehydrogenase-like NADP-dependent oxidoreductase
MRVLVVGGAGFFGRLVVDGMSADSRFRLVVAGRRPPAAGVSRAFAPLDIRACGLERRVRELAPDLVINCAGPFGPDCRPLVEAALACRSHYLDLADDRRHVLGIADYDGPARRAGLTVLSGVSSVPALSSAVVAAHRSEFARVDAIDAGISASGRVPGLGAVRSVLDQCGRSLPAWPDGRQAAAAWTDGMRVNLPLPVGSRVMASADVPDLGLFPACVPGVRRVTFRAGVASPWLMAGLRLFARLRRRGWIGRPRVWAVPMAAAASLLHTFGNGASGMFVRLSGASVDGAPLVVCWCLTAAGHQGVRVAARGAVAMAGRLLEGSVSAGARPCCGELSVDEYLGCDLPVTTQVVRLRGEAARRDEMRWRG